MNKSLDKIAIPAGILLFAEGDPGSAAYLIRDTKEVSLDFSELIAEGYVLP